LKFIKNISHEANTDEELLADYRASRDIQLLGALYSRYMDLVYGVCLKYLEDPARSQDAVMNIFEELVNKLHRHEVVNFKSWLYTLAKNHCLMQLRSVRNKPLLELNTELVQSGEEMHLTAIMDNEASLNALHKCIDGLSADQKSGITLFYLEERSYKEISQMTGTDAGKVRSLIQNGRRNLKICMDKQTDKS
jgi:RNA polymerase sigma factor (sigma-70 family)